MNSLSIAPSREPSTEEERNERLIAMGQMAASLAHEIRNPLGSMELFCSLLIEDLNDRQESQQLAQQVQTGIRTLNRVITNCLQFAREIKPKLRAVVDPACYLQTLLTTLSPQANLLQVRLELEEFGSGQPVVDPYLLEQALTNLVINAAQASAKSSQSGDWSVVTVQSDFRNTATWELRIIDQGSGIDPESLAKIFDPFFSTKTSGTGLGLAIVHAIIKAHGGEISVKSRPAAETQFTLSLPQAHRS